MPGKRVVTVSMWRDVVGGPVMKTIWKGKAGGYRASCRHDVPEAVVCKAATRLSNMCCGRFRPFLAGCPGWVWER